MEPTPFIDFAEKIALKSGAILCSPQDVQDGEARVFTLGHWRDGLEIIVARSGPALFGYVNVCAHQALPLNIDTRVRTADGLLLCDHHAAAFRFSDGLCVAGVCQGLSLMQVALAVCGDAVSVA